MAKTYHGTSSPPFCDFRTLGSSFFILVILHLPFSFDLSDLSLRWIGVFSRLRILEPFTTSKDHNICFTSSTENGISNKTWLDRPALRLPRRNDGVHLPRFNMSSAITDICIAWINKQSSDIDDKLRIFV